MIDTLTKLHEEKKQIAFLFPSSGMPLIGTIEHLSPSRITVNVVMGDKTYRFVTHPSNIVLTEVIQQ